MRLATIAQRQNLRVPGIPLQRVALHSRQQLRLAQEYAAGDDSGCEQAARPDRRQPARSVSGELDEPPQMNAADQPSRDLEQRRARHDAQR